MNAQPTLEEFIDALELKVEDPRANARQAEISDSCPVASPETTYAYARSALEREARNVAEAPEGQRNDTLNTAAFNLGQLVAAGALDESVVRAELEKAGTAAGLSEAETRKAINSGLSAGRKEPRDLSGVGRSKQPQPQLPPPQPREIDAESNPAQGPGRVRIIRGPQINEILDQAAAALAKHADRTLLFQQGAEYTRVLDGEEPTIEIATPEVVVSELDRVAFFVAVEEGKKGGIVERVTEPPKELPGRLLKIRRWPLRPLEGLSSIPVIRADGSIATARGYDRASRYFLSVKRKHPAVPERPSQADARASCAALLEPFQEYPWVGNADPGNFLH